MTDRADATQSADQSQARTSSIRPLVAGNWKMNGLKQAFTHIMTICEVLKQPAANPATDVMICPPATSLMVMAELTKDSPLEIGGQDCHIAQSGAHTGDISAAMLKDAGATAVIVGHSERREDHGETDLIVRAKALAAYEVGLVAIICVGETAGQRHAGLTLNIIKRQLAGSIPEIATPTNTTIAYEPVWAIGTGLVPTLDDVAQVHATIRRELENRFGPQGAEMRILYGGSVKPDNAASLLAVKNVNGALVGGASLKAEDFLNIVSVYQPQ